MAEQLALSLDEIGARITPCADRGVYVARLLQLNLVEYVENAGAIKLYESLGFEIFGRELGAIMVDDVLYDDFHMRLDLRR